MEPPALQNIVIEPDFVALSFFNVSKIAGKIVFESFSASGIEIDSKAGLQSGEQSERRTKLNFVDPLQ